MAGPCPFGGQASRDGFGLFPEGNFYCRHECRHICGGQPHPLGGTVGWLVKKDDARRDAPVIHLPLPRPSPPPEMGALAERYAAALPLHQEAVRYLERRGIGLRTAAAAGIGYDPERRRIAIPIRRGDRVVAIKYRYLAAKEVRYCMEAGSIAAGGYTPFPLMVVRSPALVVVEGVLDALMLLGWGVPATSPIAGAARITDVAKIARGKRIVLILRDADDAGDEAARRLGETLSEMREPFRVILPEFAGISA
ncbi:MAG: toprim domain-containing protein, partial [Anaerolineae bacterium]